MTALVVVDRVTKWYGARLAVDEVSFEVRAGEVMGLLGPNGSGKSTILRMLAGYLRSSAGSIRLDGLDVAAHGAAIRRRIGYVPEDVPLYGQMQVGEFLRFMGALKGLAGPALARGVERAAERLSLGHVLRTGIAKLSRGYRQRVAIAQALLDEPKLLILDEPTNGLDPAQIIETRELMRTLGGEHTVLVTSHILGEIEKVAHRVAILLNGRLLAIEPVAGRSSGRIRVDVGGVSTDAAAQALRKSLEAVPGVASVLPEARDAARTAYVLSLLDPAAAAAVARTIVGAGLPLLELRQLAPSLEDRFLELTRAPRVAAAADGAVEGRDPR